MATHDIIMVYRTVKLIQNTILNTNYPLTNAENEVKAAQKMEQDLIKAGATQPLKIQLATESNAANEFAKACKNPAFQKKILALAIKSTLIDTKVLFELGISNIQDLYLRERDQKEDAAFNLLAKQTYDKLVTEIGILLSSPINLMMMTIRFLGGLKCISLNRRAKQQQVNVNSMQLIRRRLRLT